MSEHAARDARPIRVVSIVQSFRPLIGGAQLQLERLLPYFDERGVQVRVLTKRVEGGHASREEVGSAEIRRIALAGASPLKSLAYVLLCVVHLIAHRRRIDVVHAYGALSEGAVALFGVLLGYPVIVRILRTGPLGDLDRLLSKPFGRTRWRLLARRAWFVSLSTEGVAEVEAAGVPPERLRLIRNGVDVARFRPASAMEKAELRARLQLPAGVVAVFTGRLWEEKRVDVPIQALPELPGLTLVVLGDGPEQERLEALAASCGVSDRVLFAGRSDEVESYLRAGDLFLLPSRSEGMSNSLLEGMACGAACVASEVSGVPELLGAGRGVILPSGDVPAWRDALAALLRDPARRRELGERAAAFVDAELRLDRTADATVQLYRDALAARRR